MTTPLQIIPPNVVTPATLVSHSVPETDYAEYAAGTTYALKDRVIVAADHMIYESLAAGNIGNTPSSSPDEWAAVRATNRWQMFDQKVGTRTSAANSFTVTVKPGKVINSVCLMELSAASVRVKVTDTATGTVCYDKTSSMVSSDSIDSFYTWFFTPIEYKTQLHTFQLPASADPSIEITVTNTGGTAECGVCIIGAAVSIAPVLAGAKVGTVDYSKKTTDEWGNTSVVARAFASRATFSLMLPKNRVDPVKKFMASIRAMPCLFVGSDAYESTTVYGFPKEFELNIDYPNYANYTLEVEGMI